MSTAKLINDARDVVEEMVQGILDAHPSLVRLEGRHVILRSDHETSKQSQVALISGGGSGHEPAHAGFIGPGMLSAAVLGGVFASPSAQSVLDAIRAVTGPSGCLLIVKNYTGDRLNFGIAAEQAKSEGLKVSMVIVGDDVAVNAGDEDDGTITGRRGLAGTLFVHKIAGAASAAGASLAQVHAEAQAAAEAVGSMGVALTTCTVPGGKRSDRIGADEMEVGLGIHNEPGRIKMNAEPVDAVVARLLDQIIAVQGGGSTKVGLMVNNLGGSPLLELYIVARAAHALLKERGYEVVRTFVGSFMTSLEMQGVMLTLIDLNDADRLSRIDAETDAPAWPRPAPGGPMRAAGRTVPVPSNGTTQSIDTSVGQDEAVCASIKSACEALISAEEELNRLDRIVGDGDCGQTIRRGAEAVLAALPKLPSASPAALCNALADVVSTSMGGSSGAVIDIMLRAAAVHLKTADDDWAGALVAGTNSATFYGGAKEGYRTMLDALIPAARKAAELKESGVVNWGAVATAAKAGADSTSNMQPRAGRSSYLDQKVTDGTADPGAVAAALAVEKLIAGS